MIADGNLILATIVPKDVGSAFRVQNGHVVRVVRSVSAKDARAFNEGFYDQTTGLVPLGTRLYWSEVAVVTH